MTPPNEHRASHPSLTKHQRRALELLLLQELVRTRDDWKTPDGDRVALPCIAALRRKGLVRRHPDRWHAQITARGRAVLGELLVTSDDAMTDDVIDSLPIQCGGQ